MTAATAPHDMIVDFITGQPVPDVGVETIRQDMEKYLVVQKGYAKSDIGVDVGICIDISGDVYRSQIDLLVSAGSRHFMVIKCAAGSLESRQREVLSAARIIDSRQIPLAVVTDGKTAVIYDTVSGRKIAEGLTAIASHSAALENLKSYQPVDISEKRLEQEKIIFRSYDGMNVNVARKIKK
ncbi:MAG: type I restriction enzyme HsdR N-terminal domain-containing protein [Desulfosalsimonadaceae bacterium]